MLTGALKKKQSPPHFLGDWSTSENTTHGIVINLSIVIIKDKGSRQDHYHIDSYIIDPSTT